jgi:hypothetical protein
MNSPGNYPEEEKAINPSRHYRSSKETAPLLHSITAATTTRNHLMGRLKPMPLIVETLSSKILTNDDDERPANYPTTPRGKQSLWKSISWNRKDLSEQQQYQRIHATSAKNPYRRHHCH